MASPLAPRRRRLVLATHGLLALWLVGNGIAHELGVSIGSARGTLQHPEDLAALLWVGAGLLVAGAFAAWAFVPLLRGRTGPALASVGVVAIVVLAIAARFGWMFLGGTSAIAVVDLGLLALGLRRA